MPVPSSFRSSFSTSPSLGGSADGAALPRASSRRRSDSSATLLSTRLLPGRRSSAATLLPGLCSPRPAHWPTSWCVELERGRSLSAGYIVTTSSTGSLLQQYGQRFAMSPQGMPQTAPVYPHRMPPSLQQQHSYPATTMSSDESSRREPRFNRETPMLSLKEENSSAEEPPPSPSSYSATSLPVNTHLPPTTTTFAQTSVKHFLHRRLADTQLRAENPLPRLSPKTRQMPESVVTE